MLSKGSLLGGLGEKIPPWGREDVKNKGARNVLKKNYLWSLPSGKTSKKKKAGKNAVSQAHTDGVNDDKGSRPSERGLKSTREKEDHKDNGFRADRRKRGSGESNASENTERNIDLHLVISSVAPNTGKNFCLK